MEEKKYTVMELAELIGVPRTTINDWLSRYSQYIDTLVQGKRKVYPETAVSVLKEIAEFRNGGKSFSDIETLLGEKHPVRGIPVTPVDEGIREAKPVEKKKTATAENTGHASGGEFAVIARQQSEELGRLIGDSFRNMDQRIQELETLSSAQRKMTFFWLAVLIVFLILIISGGILSWHYIDRARQENKDLQSRQMENSAKLTALKEESVALIAGSKAFQSNIARLESELKEQKKNFEKQLAAESKHLNELHRAKENTLQTQLEKSKLQTRETEMRLALEKEKFAAERLKMLKEMEALKKKLEGQKQIAKKSPVKPAIKAAPAKTAAKPESGKTLIPKKQSSNSAVH